MRHYLLIFNLRIIVFYEGKFVCTHSRACIKNAFVALLVRMRKPEYPSKGVTKLWRVSSLLIYGGVGGWRDGSASTLLAAKLDDPSPVSGNSIVEGVT